MTIKKFQGKTKEEAIEKAKMEFGENAVIMNVKEVKPKGFFKAMKKSTFEVTAAMEEKDPFVAPTARTVNTQRKHESIDIAADEHISIAAVPEQGEISALESLPHKTVTQKTPKTLDEMPLAQRLETKQSSIELEQKLENLQSMLEKQLSGKQDKEEEFDTQEERKDNLAFIKVLYDILLENEVDEKYINQIMDEMDKTNWGANAVDLVLSNVYQKLILKFGQPKVIEITGKKPKVIFFIGPTGVGKTTTIAKIASKFKVDEERKVAFITADTYRIAAAEQLRTYANILNIPMAVIYSPDELNHAIENVSDYDLVLVDTAGFSHKNENQKEDIHQLVESVKQKYDAEVYLVVSATTKYKDLLKIAENYKEISEYKIIFTKLDETTSYGNILNIRMHCDVELSYITNGQNVPDDIEVFDTQMIVKNLLGGK